MSFMASASRSLHVAHLTVLQIVSYGWRRREGGRGRMCEASCSLRKRCLMVEREGAHTRTGTINYRFLFSTQERNDNEAGKGVEMKR